MDIYTDYATIYDTIGQSAFSEQMAAQVLQWVRVHGWGAGPYHGRRVLDLACGTGTAALIFAAAGCHVVGVDRSVAMLSQARRKLEQSGSGTHVRFLRGDIRRLITGQRSFITGHGWDSQLDPQPLAHHSFDLVTCFSGSLNYLPGDDDLQWVCASMAELLRPGGLFVFDLHTEAEFTTWYESDQVIYDNCDYLVYNRLDYDPRRRIASRRIIWFTREIDRWWRSMETHMQRAWHDDEIRAALGSPQPPLELLARLTPAGEPAGAHDPRVVYYTRLP